MKSRNGVIKLAPLLHRNISHSYGIGVNTAFIDRNCGADCVWTIGGVFAHSASILLTADIGIIAHNALCFSAAYGRCNIAVFLAASAIICPVIRLGHMSLFSLVV